MQIPTGRISLMFVYGLITAGSSSRHDTNTGTFWQITDIHWDQQYSIYGDPTKMCHKSYNLDTVNNQYGNYKCDSPWPLVRSAIQAMVKINSKPDFILWTGDNVPHTNDPEPDFSVIFATVSNITGELRTAFPENVSILPVLGNHDAYPKDYYPVAEEEFYGQYLTKGSWSTILSEDAQFEFKKGGYYGYDLSSVMTILVINTNLYYTFNKLGVGAADPCGQFAWLRKKLQQAQDKHSKVIVAAHAPPGYFERFVVVPFFNATYNTAYVDLLTEFGDVILAQIYGHEHTDSFRLFSGPVAEQQSIGLLAPSVTPWYPSTVVGGTAINPSLRLYFYNQLTLLDYNQYHINLGKLNNTMHKEDHDTKNNNTGNSKDVVETTEVLIPTWELYYKARIIYGLTALDYRNMVNLYERLKYDDNLFQKYYLMNSAGYDNGLCDSTCKKNHLCAIANLHIKDAQQCMRSSKVNNNTDETYGKYLLSLAIGNIQLPSSRSSKILTAMVVVSMALMVVLVVTLALMLVLLVVRRNRIPSCKRSLPVSDLTWDTQRQRYKQLI